MRPPPFTTRCRYDCKRMTPCTTNGSTLLEAPAAGPEGKSVELRNVEIERSPADSRDYRALMLDNGLEALVVSDPHADKAAAAINVNVGSGDDPDDRPGLAHFLEHMLFLGTGKYPDAGEYDRFLAEHGGSGNAEPLPPEGWPEGWLARAAAGIRASTRARAPERCMR